MIRLEQVDFAYQEQNLLNKINLEIDSGEFVAIVGGNGAGKSTFLKLLNGLLKPTAGRVTIDGMDTRTTKTSELAKKIGFLFQNPDVQICKNTVREEILFSLHCVGTKAVAGHGEAKRRKGEQGAQGRCEMIMEQFGFAPEADPFSMGRGRRQMLALASVLAVSPQILVLDEPTTGLDYRECMTIMEQVADLHKEGTTVIMVSHDMELVSDFAKRMLVFGEGSILADGDCREIMCDRALLSRAKLQPPQIVELAGRCGCVGVSSVLDMLYYLGANRQPEGGISK